MTVVAWLFAHPRILGAAAAALVLAGAVTAVAKVRGHIRTLEREKTALIAERNRLAADINALVANDSRSAALVETEQARELAQAPRVREVIREVYRDRPALPAICDRALDPVRDAIGGVRGLRAAAAGGAEAADRVPAVRRGS